MITKINKILEELKTLTLIECADLIKEMEIIFNINTSISLNTTNINSKIENNIQNNSVEIEEKTAFDIFLSEVPGDKKIAILKIVRNITGLGLKESKEIVDNVPKLIKEAVTKEESEIIKKELETAGAKIIIK